MALQLGALRSALLDAGASPEKADRAAEEVASYKVRFQKIEGDLLVLKTMVGIVIAGVASLVIKAFPA